MAYIGRSPSYGAFEKQVLTADSSTTSFSLNYTVGSTSSILVSVAGVVQEPEVAYNLTSGGTSIVFSGAPTSGDTVFVIYLGIATDVGTISSGVITSQTELSETTADNDLFLVYDTSTTSLKKVQSQYLVGIASRTELAERAASDDLFLVYDTSTSTIKKIQTSNIVKASVTRSSTGDGSTTGFTVTSGTNVDNVLVFLNGVAQKPTTDYTISSTTLTFGIAPTPGEAIVIRELPA